MSTPATTDGLVVVHVRDQVDVTLAGHDGREYTSPPHQRADALALVALLLGRPAQPDGDGASRAAGAARSPADSARSRSTPSPASRRRPPTRAAEPSRTPGGRPRRSPAGALIPGCELRAPAVAGTASLDAPAAPAPHAPPARRVTERRPRPGGHVHRTTQSLTGGER